DGRGRVLRTQGKIVRAERRGADVRCHSGSHCPPRGRRPDARAHRGARAARAGGRGVTPFDRQPEPTFWAAKEAQWLALGPSFGNRDPLNKRVHERRTLGTWFQDLVRAPGAPRLCAYCDVSLEEGSRET